MKRVQVINSKKSIVQLLNENVPSGYIHRKNKGTQIRFNPSVKNFMMENGFNFGLACNDEQTKVYLLVGKDEVAPVRKNSNQTASSFTALLDLVYHTEGVENYHPDTNRYDIIFNRMDGATYIYDVIPVEEVDEREANPENVEKARAALMKYHESRKEETVESFEEPTVDHPADSVTA